MRYNFKPGDKVVCIFSHTSDDTGGKHVARTGKVVEYHAGRHNEVLVDFGRGFDGHSGDFKPFKRTRWWVNSEELGLVPAKGLK